MNPTTSRHAGKNSSLPIRTWPPTSASTRRRHSGDIPERWPRATSYSPTSNAASWFKRPRHHQRELFSPERVAVRSDALGHDDVRACTAQRGRPPRRVLEEERLQRAGDEVRARKRTRHHGRRSVASRPAKRRRSRRRCRGVEAPWRAQALRSPTHRTPRCARQATRLRSATAPTGGRPRRRTAREPRTAPGRSPVSTRGAAASRRPAGVHRRSSSAARRPPPRRRPTARSAARHPRTRFPGADPAGRRR